MLRFFSDGQIQQPIFEKQVNENFKKEATRIDEIGVGTAQVATGAYTGRALTVATSFAPDKTLNIGKDILSMKQVNLQESNRDFIHYLTQKWRNS